MRGVTVILPTYEEASNLPVILPRIAAALRPLECPFEIVVVDDNSPDGSAGVAEDIAAEAALPVRVVSRRDERSLATAVVRGAVEARYLCVAVLDADLSHDPDSLPALLGPIVNGTYDVVVGSRYAGGEISGWPLRRRVTSRTATLFARLLTRVADPLSGFFATRRELLDGSTLALKPRGYKILLELLGRSRGLRVCEVPIVFTDRASGKSKFGTREIVHFLAQCAALAADGVIHRASKRRAIEAVGAGSAATEATTTTTIHA